MRRRGGRLPFLREILAYIAVYPFLIFILVMTVSTCFFAGTFVPSVREILAGPAEIHIRRLPGYRPGQEVTKPASQAELAAVSLLPEGALVPASPAGPDSPPAAQTNPAAQSANPPDQGVAPQQDSSTTTETTASQAEVQLANPAAGPNLPPVEPALPTPSPSPTLNLVFKFPTPPAARPRRPTPTPDNVLAGLVSGLMEAIDDSPDVSRSRSAALPTLTPTGTSTPTPTETPTPTPTPTETPIPTDTPVPTATPLPTETPIPTNTPVPPPPPPPPTDTPVPTATPKPEYDFLLNEFYNSPTSNSFIVMYVAIVDAKDIPIGGMKVVGTRLDHHLTYQSPLSTWYFEGYNAPGQVIKSGNVKFEPPGGIETTAWILHLEDANGVRMSDDVPFDTNQNDKQWYFLKFRRKF